LLRDVVAWAAEVANDLVQHLRVVDDRRGLLRRPRRDVRQQPQRLELRVGLFVVLGQQVPRRDRDAPASMTAWSGGSRSMLATSRKNVSA
jgi:hypothetical protein